MKLSTAQAQPAVENQEMSLPEGLQVKFFYNQNCKNYLE